jgi:hypothetical protein
MKTPPGTPAESEVMKCRKCKAEYTIPAEEKEELIKRFDKYCPPKTCPECRKKSRAFKEMIDSIRYLHAWAFGVLNTKDKLEALHHLSQRVVLDAQRAGLLDGKKLFIPVGEGEIRAEINAYRESLGLKDERLWTDPRFPQERRQLVRD